MVGGKSTDIILPYLSLYALLLPGSEIQPPDVSRTFFPHSNPPPTPQSFPIYFYASVNY